METAEFAFVIKEKHSGLGIASFVVSMICGLAILALIVVAGLVEATTPGGMDAEPVIAMVVGLAFILFMLGALVALILGIVALFQKERKKVFAIIGTVFSALALVGTFALMMIGLAME